VPARGREPAGSCCPDAGRGVTGLAWSGGAVTPASETDVDPDAPAGAEEAGNAMAADTATGEAATVATTGAVGGAVGGIGGTGKSSASATSVSPEFAVVC
jgi:hypothetical protein